MEPFVDVATARALDARALNELGVPSLVLMESAGAAAAEALCAWWGTGAQTTLPHVLVLCGAGHNGGDGFVVARRLVDRVAHVTLVCVHEQEALVPDAQVMQRAALGVGVVLVRTLDELDRLVQREPRATPYVVVDAVLGTGARSPVAGIAAALLQWMARHAERMPVVALDLPSGLDGDTGAADPLTPVAALTVTFGLAKRGLQCGQGPRVCGRVVVADLGLPRSFRWRPS